MLTQAKPKTLPLDDRTPIGDLVRLATDSNRTASERGRTFGEIVARFQDMAYGMAFTLLSDAHLAEDAAQESFLAAWRQLENLREPDAFPGWFQCIVRTQCNRLTRGKRLMTSPLHLVPETAAPSFITRHEDPLQHAEQVERRVAVQAAIASLPPHERTATVLYYLGDEEQIEIAAFLGVPVTTVKKRVFSARKRLRERMTPYMEPKEIVQEAMDATRPSRNIRFSHRILLWAAVEEGDAGQVRDLLQEDPTLARATSASGDLPLHIAACCGYTAVVEALLSAGAEPNALNRNGQTALHSLAAGSATAEIAGLLLASSTSLAAIDNRGETALQIAARFAVPQAEDSADHFGFAEFLLSRGATLDLRTAIALDRADDIAALIEADKESLQRPDSAGDLPLHFAARSGYRRVTGAVLQAGADINAKNLSGQTALQIAAQPGRERHLPPHSTVVALLKERGGVEDIIAAACLGDTVRLEAILAENRAALQLTDSSGATALCHAAWQGNTEAVRYLLAQGASVPVRDRSGATALSQRRKGQPVKEEIVDLLLNAGALMELRTALALGRSEAVESLLSGSPALADSETVAWAIENQVPSVLVERLAAYGAKLSPQDAAALGLTPLLARFLTADSEMPRRRDSERRTPLHAAAAAGQLETIRFLIERGAMVDAMMAGGVTPLHLACSGEQSDVVAYLISVGSNVDQSDHRGETPLSIACANGAVQIARLLLEKGAIVKGSAKTTPLHLAAQTGNAELVALLLGYNAPLEARNYYGATPLHIAVREGHAFLVTLLLTAGADRTARDQWHRTPLHTAAWFDRAEIAELLLDAGVLVTELSYGYSTPLHTAAERGSVAVAERLLKRGADINARTDFGRTPLHDAVHGNHPEMVTFLLRRGADPTSPNNRQMTPLHWAAAAGKAEIVRLLLSAGADTTVRSYKDETPADLARRYHHDTLATLIGG